VWRKFKGFTPRGRTPSLGMHKRISSKPQGIFIEGCTASG